MASTSSAPNAAAAQTLRIRPPAFTEGKLDGTNYTLWKFKITAILDSYELLDVVQGVDAEPQPTPDPANPGNMLPPDADLLRAWKRKNADAMCALVTSTTDSVLTLIQHTTKAPEAWSILKGQYETQNQTRIQNLENQLAMKKLNEGETAAAFITRIKNLRDLMAGAGIKKSSEDLARKCLLVCPPKFDGLPLTLR